MSNSRAWQNPSPPTTEPEFQPASTTFEPYILPNDLSNQNISSGSRSIFHYYLGANNTIPFVRLECGGTSKELSWGEIIEVPSNVSVNVRNVSYMPGDLQLQSGKVPSPGPRRLSVPVKCKVAEIENADGYLGTIVTPAYPCDTRRAVRAYMSIGFSASNSYSSMDIVCEGYFKQHARPTDSPLPEAYADTYHITEDFPEIIPLGTSLSGNAMRLADYAVITVSAFPTVRLPIRSVPIFIDAFYLLEY